MINSTKAIHALSEKLESMSHEEREEYFKKMGFSFDVAESDMDASEKDGFARYVSAVEQLSNSLDILPILNAISLSSSNIRKSNSCIVRFVSQYDIPSHKSSTKKQGGKPSLVTKKRKGNPILVH